MGVLKSCQPRSGDEPKHSKSFLNEVASQVYLSLLDLDLIPSPPTATKSEAIGGRRGRQGSNAHRARKLRKTKEKRNDLSEAYIDLARRHQTTVGGMNEECLILLYVGLSCVTVRSVENPPLMSVQGLFTEMAMYPGLKIHPVVHAAASRLLSISILTVKLRDLEKSIPIAYDDFYSEMSQYLGNQLAALDRTREVGVALDFVNFVHLLTCGRPNHAAVATTGLRESEWIAGLMAISSWPRNNSNERLQIVCLNAIKNILGATTPDRFSGEERQAVVCRLFEKIHDLLWGRMRTRSLARAIAADFDVKGAINCAFERNTIVSRNLAPEGMQEQRDGFAWARHTVNCGRGGSSIVEWKVTLLEGCDALVGVCSASAVSRCVDAAETESEDVWLFNAKSGRLHSHQFFSRRMEGCSEGDVLTLSVDCDRAILSISKNGEGFRVAFAGLPRDTDLRPMFILSGDTAVQLSEVVVYNKPTATGSLEPGSGDETGPTEVETCMNGCAPYGEAVAQTVVEVLRHLYERNHDWGEAIEAVVVQALCDDQLLECLRRITPAEGKSSVLLGAFVKDRPHLGITASQDLDAVASKALPALALLADVDRGLRVGSRVSCGGEEGIVVRVPELSDAFLPPTIEVYWTSKQLDCR